MLNRVKKNVKKAINEYGSTHTTFRAGSRKVMHSYYYMHNAFDTFYIRTDPRVVMFASFEGRSYSDSPKALFEYMVKCGVFDGFTFVWGFKKNVKAYEKELHRIAAHLVQERGVPKNAAADDENPAQAGPAEAASPAGPRIIVVRYNSVDWRKYQAKAKYWIYNFKIADEIYPKKDQIFLQCWHGVPLKRLGFDLEHFDSATNTEEGIKRRYAAEAEKFMYFLTPCPYATEKFTSAWQMDVIGKTDCLLEEGYPRDDILVKYTPEMVSEIKRRIFGEYFPEYEKLSGKKTMILYAPTYRADEYEVGKGHTVGQHIDFDRMRDLFGDDCVILFRAHYLVAELFDFEKYRGFVFNVSDVDDINDLYLISDMMITDYSSSMFDYAILKRPMIFYMYDLEHYRDESNGFYFDPYEVLPGPIVKDEDALFEAVRAAKEAFVYDERYAAFNARFNPLADGKSSYRVLRRLFAGKEHRNA